MGAAVPRGRLPCQGRAAGPARGDGQRGRRRRAPARADARADAAARCRRHLARSGALGVRRGRHDGQHHERHGIRRDGARQLGVHLRQGAPPRPHRHGGVSGGRLQRDRPRVGRAGVPAVRVEGGRRAQGSDHRLRLSLDRAHVVHPRLGRRLEVRAQGGGGAHTDRRHPRGGGPRPGRGRLARRLRPGPEVRPARRRHRRAAERPHPRRDLRPGGVERHHRLPGRRAREVRNAAGRRGRGQAGRGIFLRAGDGPALGSRAAPRGPAAGGRGIRPARGAPERGDRREPHAHLPARLLAEPHGRAADRRPAGRHRSGRRLLSRVALRRHADAGSDHGGGRLQPRPHRRPHHHLHHEREVDTAPDGEHPRRRGRRRPLRAGGRRHDPVLRHGADVRPVQRRRRAGRGAARGRGAHRPGAALRRRLGAHPLPEQHPVRRRAHRRERTGLRRRAHRVHPGQLAPEAEDRAPDPGERGRAARIPERPGQDHGTPGRHRDDTSTTPGRTTPGQHQYNTRQDNAGRTPWRRRSGHRECGCRAR